MSTLRRGVLGVICGVLLALSAAPAQAAFDDPLFLLRPAPPLPPPGQLPPPPLPPTRGTFEGPCGVSVDNAGNVYLSDYYQNAIDLFGPNISSTYPYDYRGQYINIDPLDGPCGLAIDAASNIYANDFHRSVFKYPPLPIFPKPLPVTAVPLATIVAPVLDEAGPTGVAIDSVAERLYVDERDHIAVFTLAGAPLEPIGVGSLEDGYGVAYSAGRVFVADAKDSSVKIYSATPGSTTLLDTIDGSETPLGDFTSLRDSAIAVDNVTGEIYVVDNLQPFGAERPEAVVWVFDSAGAYKGRLKNSVVFGQPTGLAVDNSATASQGRVYVTTGNTEKAALYAYPPGAATTNSVPLSSPPVVVPEAEGESGAVSSVAPSVAPAAVAVESPAPAPAAAGSTAPSAKPQRAHKRHRGAKHKKHRAAGHRRARD